MELTDKQKILILVGVLLIVIFLFVKNKNTDDDENEQMHNEGALTQDVVKPTKLEQPEIKKQELGKTAETDMTLLKKFKARNTSKDGDYVEHNYAEGKRGGKAVDLDKFFEEGNPLDNNQSGFEKNDPDNKYAGYIPGKPYKMKDVDKFNAESLLPKEKHKDWFDDPYESTSVKNTHLINIYRPIGVNTIQTSLKNPSWDIRGSPVVPKTVVSPFLNSSIEPDTNLRPQSLCY